MSQQFQADAQILAANVTVVTTAETNGPQTNFVTPPFGTFKAKVIGVLFLTVGTGTTVVTVRLRRNINAENVVIGTPQAVTVIAGNTVVLVFAATDSVPDGRSVQYTLTVTQTGATANGTFLAGSYVEAVALSG